MTGETNQTVEQEKGKQSLEQVTANFGVVKTIENGEDSASHEEANHKNADALVNKGGKGYPSGQDNIGNSPFVFVAGLTVGRFLARYVGPNIVNTALKKNAQESSETNLQPEPQKKGLFARIFSRDKNLNA